MTCSHSDPFTDYLTVTYSPEQSEVYPVRRFLLAQGARVVTQDKHKAILHLSSQKPAITGLTPVSHGTFRLEERDKFTAISASGLALAHLRAGGIFEEYLQRLAQSPHKVTRLDATVDVYDDAPKRLAKLEREYPTGEVSFTRKAVKITRLMSIREDGKESGTWYAGHRGSARVSARVYDKALELFERKGILTAPTTRYELIFRKDYGVTLKDAQNPSALFWTHSDPLLLQAPPGHWEWEPYGEFTTWQPISQVDKSPAQVLRQRIEQSSELEAWLSLADEVGKGGRKYLLRLVTEKLSG